jgi:CzcA family heavy metal efflux pump
MQSQASLRHGKLVLFVVAVLAVLGTHAYLVAPQRMFPAMSFSRIDVVADAGDLPPDQVRIAVTRPLETALETLPSVVGVRGTSSQGSSELLVEFDPKTDPRVDLQYVEQALAQARSAIPQVKDVEALVVDPSSEPVVSYALTSPILSQAVVRQLAQARIIPALLGVPGLARALIAGGPQIEYHVELDPAALAATGLSAGDVATAIAESNDVESFGSGVSRYERYVFLIDSTLHDVASIKRIAIPLKNGGSIALSTIADVRLGVAPMTTQASYDGRHAVILSVYALPGADAVALAKEIARRIDALRPVYAPNIAISPYWDQTRLIVDSQRALRDAILLGAALAVLVIHLFLRNLRMTLVAAAVIPLAMSIAVLILVESGRSLNLMSVGGLAVAVGLIIDDAIVVLENIARHFAENSDGDRQATIARAVAQLARPMAASSATTVVVFVPLALLGGVAGYFFRAFAFTLASALIVSLALALLVTPLLADLFLRGARTIDASRRPKALSAGYEPVLRWALRRRRLVLAGAAAILAVTVLVLTRLPSDFLPSMNEGQFEIKYTMPPGFSLAATDAAATAMERIVLKDPAVRAEGRLTGIDTNGFSPTQQNSGTIRVALAPGARYEQVSERLRAAIGAAVPAATLDFHQILEDQINDLSGNPSPIEITLTGSDQQTLVGLADRLAARIGRVPGIVDPFDGVVYDDPTIAVALSQRRMTALGLRTNEVASALASRANGVIATEIPQDTFMIPLRVGVAAEPLNAEGMRSNALFTQAGPISLGTLGTVRRPALASEINDENGRLVVRVTANIANTRLSSAIAGVKAQIAQLGLPPGYTATIGGAYRAQQSTFADFIRVFAVAVTLVFGVMLATFGSFRLPLVILTAIPLSLIGVALALLVTGTPLNVSSFMGLLLLIGIVVKNGILLIDVANRRRRVGDGVEAALIAAGKARLRPIVMTTLAAIGGLLPLACGTGSGSEMQKPLAIAVIGGLSTATLFTLIVIPVLYAAFTSWRAAVRRVHPAAATMGVILVVVLSLRPVAAQTSAIPLAVPLGFVNLPLEVAIHDAIARSPEVASAAAALEEARTRLDQARRSLGLSATFGYSEAPQGEASGTIAQRISSGALGLQVGDLLAYGPLVASAAAAERSAEADLANERRLERIKTIDLYYAALTAHALVTARTSALASAQAVLDAARKRNQAGDAPRLDVVRAEVAVAKARADLALAQAADANAADALERETGVSTLIPEPANRVDPAAAAPSPASAVARAEHLRSDVLSAKDAVVAAQAALHAAELQAVPPITVSGGYNTGIDTGFHIAGPTLSASMTLPIPSTARNKVIARRTQLATAQAKVASVLRALDLEVAAAARNLAAAIDAERASDEALRSAQEELAATTLGYRNGVSSSLELTTARSTYDQAVVDAFSSTYDRLAAEAKLNAEVGR